MKHRTLTALCAAVMCIGSSATLIRAEPPADPPAAGDKGNHGGDGRRAGGMLTHLQEALNALDLSSEQTERIDSILADARQRMMSLREELKEMEGPERREKMMATLEEFREKIAAVLTDEQKAALKQKIEEAREQMGGGPEGADGPRNGPPGGRLAQLGERMQKALDQLELSDEQKSKAREIVDELKTELTTLRDKAAEDANKARVDALAALNAGREKLKEILTPEQQEKLRNLLRPPGGRGETREDRERGERGKKKDHDKPADGEMPDGEKPKDDRF